MNFFFINEIELTIILNNKSYKCISAYILSNNIQVNFPYQNSIGYNSIGLSIDPSRINSKLHTILLSGSAQMHIFSEYDISVDCDRVYHFSM